MKPILFSLLLALTSTTTLAQLLVSKTTMLSFYSSTVLEDIEAKSQTASSAINTKTGELLFKVSNTSFKFQKKLMQEHFNENYMESEKYPYSEFKGKIDGDWESSKNGSYRVKVNGNLTIHGVTKAYSAPVELLVKDGTVSATSTFRVRIADHGIEIPTLVFKNIAEYVAVKVAALYQTRNP